MYGHVSSACRPSRRRAAKASRHLELSKLVRHRACDGPRPLLEGLAPPCELVAAAGNRSLSLFGRKAIGEDRVPNPPHVVFRPGGPLLELGELGRDQVEAGVDSLQQRDHARENLDKAIGFAAQEVLPFG